jgi:hypothetical protein
LDKIFKMENYNLGYTITSEMIEDQVAEAMADKYTTALANSLGMTKEAVAASIWERRSPLDKPWEKEVDFE